MRKLLIVLMLLPFCAPAQSYKDDKLQDNFIDRSSGDSVLHTYWHVLCRGNITDQLTIFYRFSKINDRYSLDIKVMDAGSDVVVARNAELRLLLDDGSSLSLYNSAYAVSCIGCGARGYMGSDAPGISLSYPVSGKEMTKLQRSYVERVKIYVAYGYWQRSVHEYNSEVFFKQANLVFNSGFHAST